MIANRHEGGIMETNFGQKPFVYQVKNGSHNEETFMGRWMRWVNYSKGTNDKLFGDHLNDLKIISRDNQETECHRLILSVRSDVFKAMFQPEKKNGEYYLH